MLLTPAATQAAAAFGGRLDGDMSLDRERDPTSSVLLEAASTPETPPSLVM
jgi:hypothetical protein